MQVGGWRTSLSQDVLDHPAVVDVEAFATGDFQAAVIQAEQMQDRSVEVGDVMPFAQRVVAEFVGRTMDVTPLESRSGHPDRKTVGMMIAAGGPASAKFEARRTAKLRSEYHDDVV